VSRFVVRRTVSDLQYCLFKVWDTTQRQFVFTTTREATAESYARVFERAGQAEAVQRMESGAW
jgi:hypothetical protein